VVIDFLANHKTLIPEVTELVYGQWSDLFQAAGTSKEQLKILFEERAVLDKLPITVVALEEGVLLGTGSIKLTEPGTKPALSPWLAGMYVKASHRRAGVGALIVTFLEAKAQDLGVEQLYLSVGAAQDFYQRLGWRVLERVHSYGVKDVALMSKRLKREVA
jgi:GNAT superfamily N-acetyltransferase